HMAKLKPTRIIVVGAGPVGLLTALMLGQSGCEVEVLDAAMGIDPRPRGAAYGPPAVRVLRRAGVLDKVRAVGFEARDMCWRELGGKYIAGFSRLEDPGFDDRSIVLPVHLLASLLHEEVKALANVKLHWGHSFVGLIQDESQVTVQVETSQGGQPTITSLVADFVIGCDGARSAVRKALFKDSFPGFSWDVQIVATNIRYDGFKKHGWSDVQWIIHPEHWFLACRLDNTDLWRVAYGVPFDINDERLRQELAAKFETILPGNPKEGQYELLRWSPFIMHQRCVERMQVGRVLLAGDAAHLCNPMGGLGLTGGLADVGSLVDCIRGIHEGRASLKILEVYCQKRRAIYHNFIDPVSTANLNRCRQEASGALKNDEVLKMIKIASED
ncbi:uncharacterized protein A1O9_07111, partial [Exophiala aquamarina CBS 119918]